MGESHKKYWGLSQKEKKISIFKGTCIGGLLYTNLNTLIYALLIKYIIIYHGILILQEMLLATFKKWYLE